MRTTPTRFPILTIIYLVANCFYYQVKWRKACHFDARTVDSFVLKRDWGSPCWPWMTWMVSKIPQMFIISISNSEWHYPVESVPESENMSTHVWIFSVYPINVRRTQNGKCDPDGRTYLLLLISMLWHRQAIFESKGDKLSSSAEGRIRTHQGLRHQIASRLNAHWQTDWAIEDQAKNLYSTARPYDQRAFSSLDPTAVWHSHLVLAIYIFVVVRRSSVTPDLLTGGIRFMEKSGPGSDERLRTYGKMITKLWMELMMLLDIYIPMEFRTTF